MGVNVLGLLFEVSMANPPRRESGVVDDVGEGMWYRCVNCPEVSDGVIIFARSESVS